MNRGWLNVRCHLFSMYLKHKLIILKLWFVPFIISHEVYILITLGCRKLYRKKKIEIEFILETRRRTAEAVAVVPLSAMQPGPTTYYNFHKFLLSILGLWPYNRSKFLIIKNTAFVFVPAIGLIPQVFYSLLHSSLIFCA